MKKENRSYIDDMIEMQEKQFIPGYYTGGRMRPWRRWAQHKPKYLAVMYIVSAVMAGAASALFISFCFDRLILILPASFAGFLAIGCFIAGIKYWKMKPGPAKKSNKKKPKNIERK